MFEIALVDCKVLGIVRTLVEGSSAWKAIELRPGEIWPDSCHSRTKPSYVRPNRWRTLRGEYYRAPILVWTVLAYWNLWLPVCFTWIPRLVWVLVLESLRLTSVLGVGWNLNFSLIFSSILDIVLYSESNVALAFKQRRGHPVYWIRNGVEKGERASVDSLSFILGDSVKCSVRGGEGIAFQSTRLS